MEAADERPADPWFCRVLDCVRTTVRADLAARQTPADSDDLKWVARTFRNECQSILSREMGEAPAGG